MPLLKVEAVVDLDSLVNSANEVEADGGEKVEAMLGRRLRRCWGGTMTLRTTALPFKST